jgi:3-oxoadipate enol-lactonase
MTILKLPDCELFYEVTGTGPALLFAHGLGGNHISWWQQVPFFSKQYTCITFAHRGFAPSTDPAGVGPDAFVDDLAALIDHLSLKDVRLAAQSMGGWTCLGYALRHPGKVRALVMCATTGTASNPDIDRAFASRAGAEADLFQRGIHPAAGERMAREQPALQFLYREIDGLSYVTDKQAVRAKLVAMRTTPREALSRLSMPVLCVSGAEDVVMPTAAVEAFAQLLPNAQLVQIAEAGHSVYFERPHTFNRLVADFLEAVDERGHGRVITML